MKYTRLTITFLLVYFAFGGSLSQATEEVLYKSILPDGSVSYSDKPLPGVPAQMLAVEPHPPDRQAAQDAEIETVKRREQMLRNFDARADRVALLDQQISVAAVAVEQAREQAQRAAAVGEGDRQGRRLTAEYFNRQQLFREAQAQAERRLNNLLQQRAALQP